MANNILYYKKIEIKNEILYCIQCTVVNMKLPLHIFLKVINRI